MGGGGGGGMYAKTSLDELLHVISRKLTRLIDYDEDVDVQSKALCLDYTYTW